MSFAALSELWIWELIARLHPLLVHFPIGALIIAFFLESLTLGDRNPELRPGIRWLVYIGAGTALVSALVGLMLAYGKNYSASTLFYHRWGGILTAVLAGVAAVFLYRGQASKRTMDFQIYRWGLVATVLVLTATGHFGASLTHGDDYISSTFPWNQESLPSGKFSELVQEVKKHQKMGEIADKHKTELNVGVRRIFAQKCFRCHDSEKSEGDLKLTSEKAVMKGGENGPIIEPGKPEESELVRRISLPGSHEEVMPKKGSSLGASEIALIRTWVDVGAPWTDQEVKTFREAELALDKPETPDTQTEFDNPLDRFTAAYFREHNMSWPEPVDDATFMRRAYLDVIGLLPETEELKSFMKNDDPNKREQLVDELLSRKHDYAQHWLTFWNDLLRNNYTGTGFITGGREQISDWLYDALYNNKPYDQMVQELVDPNDRSDGFIKGIKWRGAVNASQTTEMQAAQNISQSLLGKNLKCASCHDSFVSNLTLKDAYSFAQIFSEETLQIQRCDVPTGETAEAGFIYSEELGDVNDDLPKGKRLAQLADIITSDENGRLYRTIANRYWELLMGRGLVEPVDKMDNRPWSKKHLDWLAAKLREKDADLKQLLTTILTSRTYQLPAVSKTKEQPESGTYQFRGPVIRRMTAEQFADAVSQIAGPFDFKRGFNPTDSSSARATWIWSRTAAEKQTGKNVSPGTSYFRRPFNLPDDRAIKQASVLISVDNAYRLFVNGTSIGQGDSWKTTDQYNVTSHLNPGKNVLAVEGNNGGSGPNPAGVLLNLRVTFDHGESIDVRSDEQWKAVYETPSTGWKTADFDDSNWSGIRTFGTRSSNDTWTDLKNFSHDLSYLRASLAENNPFLKALGRPSRENVVTNRQSESTLLQALELSNGEQLIGALSRGADRLIREYGTSTERMIKDLYLHAYGRRPSKKELLILENKLSSRASTEPSKAAVQDVLWAIVMNPEFQLIH